MASVTEYDCVPAACVKVPVPVYGAVPPVALIVTVDEPPKQAIAVWLSAATNCVGWVITTEFDVAVHAGVLTSLAVTVYVPAPTVNVLLAWNGAPPVMLYSTAPAAPVAIAVKVVVPPLHAIVPADAVTERLHAATTSIVDEELLSFELSPFKLPAGPPQVEPFIEKVNCPITVEGPPMVLPCTFINIVRLVFTGITSLPLHTVITEPALDNIVQPAGNPVCNAFGNKLTIPPGTVIAARTLLGPMPPVGPVLPTVTCISIICPCVSWPLFGVSTLI